MHTQSAVPEVAFSNRRPQSSFTPLWRTAWRRIVRRPFQYVLLVLGVALGVAMMVSIDLANGSASRAFALSTDAVAGRTTHRIVGGPGGLDEAVYHRLRTEVGYTPAAPVVEGYLLARELGNQPLRLVGVDPFAEPPFRTYFGGQEAGPADGLGLFLARPNTVFLSADLAGRYGLGLGDTITLSRAGQRTTVQVVGLLQPADEASRRALDSLVFGDVATAQEILGMAGRLSHVDLIAADEAALAPLAGILPPGARLEPAAARSNALQQMTAAFTLNLTALSLLALVVGMFLIYNTVTFSVVQRRQLFGILRCLGVTGGQLFGLILGEAAALGLVGALLGLALGVVLGRGMVRLVTQTINDFYFVVNVQSVTVPPGTLVKGLVIGLAAALLASAVPAWEAMSTAPQSSLRRSTLESKAQRAMPWFALIFAVLAAAGLFFLWLPGVSLVFAFVGLLAVLIACAFLTPGLTVGLMGLLTPPAGRLFGPLGRMALRDIVRSLSRTSVAIAALMVAVAVIVGVSIMIGSFRQTVAQWLNNTLQADVYLSPPALTASRIEGNLAPDVVAAAANWPGVAQAVAARHVNVLAPDLGRPVEVVAVSGDVSNGNRNYAWVDGRRDELWQRFSNGEGIFVSEPLVIRDGLGLPPPPLRLMTEAGPRSFPVLAVFYDYSSDQGSILIDDTLFAKWWGEAPVTTMGLFLAPGQDVDQVAAGLQAHFGGREDVVIRSNQAVRGNALDIFDRTFAITAALQLLAIVVAFIGVLSALMSLQLERTRELGVLRATGLTRQQLWQLTLLETGLMGGTAGLLAMPVGWVLAWILIYIINRRSFGWTLQMDLDPVYFLQALAVALAAALLAGVYPALRLGNMVVAAAIRDE
ncbi:MAG: ABC transporter permease [Chloroflexi bacterium]|nr:ABC transporter permease [Chloroflexota bacterium]MCI0576636.1 ABC transporter permease [Chloroflexota bacterium]MCI0646996.1 ABC transporter permease [Chloroflexota bacterium]MCI0730696.1 ABC transporter permease [Chloroflexota bacterium]